MRDLEVLKRLVARYSPSGQEASAVREFVRLARARGYRARTDAAGNGIAEIGHGRPTILFLGHIDTVAGPRPVVLRRGRLHGRGAVDAKGPLAAALIAGTGFAGPGTFRIVASVEEEVDSRGARHLARGAAPDALIVGEPSGWDGVTVAYKGIVRLEATFRQPRAHWSAPEPTAADRAVRWASVLSSLATRHAGGSPFRSLTAKVVDLRCRAEGDPEVASVTVDLRLPPGLSTSAVLRELRAEEDGAPRPRLRLLARAEAVEVPRNEPAAVALCGAIRAEGGVPTLWRRGGSSDLNVVAPAWGIGGVAYGPGDARLDHTERESLAIDELQRAARILRGAVESLAGRLTPPRSAAAP